MKKATWNPRLHARFSPENIDALDPTAAAVKHPWNAAAGGRLNGCRPLPLFDQNCTEALGEREVSALAILRFPWLEAKPPSVEIHVLPLTRQDLARHTPTCDVSDFDDRLQVLGKVVENGIELLALEEPLPNVVLQQEGDVGDLTDLANPLAEPEHALQRRELSIDAGVRRSLALAKGNEGGNPVSGDLDCAGEPEEVAEVVDRPLGTHHGPPAVDLIVIDEQFRQVLEACSLYC